MQKENVKRQTDTRKREEGVVAEMKEIKGNETKRAGERELGPRLPVWASKDVNN